MSAWVKVCLTPDDTRQLKELLLSRPHNEEWSNRVLEEIEAALTAKSRLHLVGKEPA